MIPRSTVFHRIRALAANKNAHAQSILPAPSHYSTSTIRMWDTRPAVGLGTRLAQQVKQWRLVVMLRTHQESVVSQNSRSKHRTSQKRTMNLVKKSLTFSNVHQRTSSAPSRSSFYWSLTRRPAVVTISLRGRCSGYSEMKSRAPCARSLN